MSSPLAGSISATGVANAVQLGNTTQDTLAMLEISPGAVSYVGAQLVFEALPVGASKWFPLNGLEQDTQAFVTGTSATPFTVTPDGSIYAFKFDISLCQAIRVWAFALTSGTININWSSGSFFASPPGSGPGTVGGLSMQQAILYELMQLGRMAAEVGGPLAQAIYKQNPVLPGGLPTSIWDS